MTQKTNQKRKRAPAYSADTMVVCLIMGLLLIALGVLIFLADALGMAGEIFDGLRTFSRGMCGAMAVVLPIIPAWGGILLMISTQRKPPMRAFLLGCLMFFFICSAATLLTFVGSASLLDYAQSIIAQTAAADSMPAYMTRLFDLGARYSIGGGLIGTLLAWPLWKGIGNVPGAILVILATVITFLFLIRLDVRGIIAKGKSRQEDRRARQAAEEAAQRQQELAWQQEQMRIRQEQARMQEQMRQQRIQQQLQAQQLQTQQQPPAWANQPIQPGFDDMNAAPAAPIVRQVQTRGKSKTPPHGFQPTPEELGQADEMLQPMPDPARKKRGGIFSRDKGDDAVAIPRKRTLFDRKDDSTAPTPAAQPPQDMPPVPQSTSRVRPTAQTARTARVEPVAPMPEPTPAAHAAPVYAAEPDETPAPRRRSPFQRPEPDNEMDEPDFTYTEEPQIFTPAQQAPAQPAKPIQPAPPEDVDTGFAAEAETKPANENSFLARLRAAKKAAGLEVPEDEPQPERDQRPEADRNAGAPPRPAARSFAGQAQSAEPDWADIPPWKDVPARPSAPMQPVVTSKKPEGSYEPELNLKPRRSGSDAPAPMFEEKVEVPYVFPTMDLLKTPEPQAGISPEEDAVRARRLENTLQSFRVPAKVRHITHGPAISRFELELAAGIKVSKVTDLNKNIAMNMEVKSVRIEAPIPGKSLVGVEVPNKQRATVTLREVLESEPMRKATKPLVVALGKDIAGTPIVCDLAKMPHLLIAGATGSGKSVCINTIINSLLYRCTPKEVRLILVDPKVVELQCYNGIPHLLIPVVSDPHKASGALAWAVGEMMDRYKRFQEAGVRAIDGYNEQASEDDKMPRIVIVIDELADLMMTCKKDVEERICRLAQLARAAGIHLIVATQRPSVDVITGLIKANIPSRIAFKVSSNVDSRTILDRIGAEQLLGYGDMLYAPTGEFTPIRVQGCFLSDPEVNRITDFIRENCPADYDPSVLEELDRLQAEADQNSGAAMPEVTSADDYVGSDESLLAQCIEMAVNDGQVSTSLIQRRLRLGYARAGRLVDEMQARGIVGPKDGAKPRMCLISREEYEAMKAAGELDQL